MPPRLFFFQGPLNGGGFQTGGFPDLDLSFLFCPFWDFPDFSGSFPICSGTLRGFSRSVLSLFRNPRFSFSQFFGAGEHPPKPPFWKHLLRTPEVVYFSLIRLFLQVALQNSLGRGHSTAETLPSILCEPPGPSQNLLGLQGIDWPEARSSPTTLRLDPFLRFFNLCPQSLSSSS